MPVSLHLVRPRLALGDALGRRVRPFLSRYLLHKGQKSYVGCAHWTRARKARSLGQSAVPRHSAYQRTLRPQTHAKD